MYLDAGTVSKTISSVNGGAIFESLVALAFLSPGGLGKWRDAILLVFMFGTYVVAPVASFGTILCAIGLAQTNARWARAGYVLCSWECRHCLCAYL